ncbi:uncharacterized protein RJT20DRAFT_116613 [Scheffersomyces xylosifermentans]|uniref:uncharacterized protein n=1 Tax=Scheffersomyces xylosifermentans TaxID=1304137 RepID=UPI00315DE704
MGEGTKKKNGASVGQNSDDDGLFNQYIGTTEVPDETVIEAIFSERRTEHADDAVDYEDIDELADDEDLPEEEEPTNAAPDDDLDAFLGGVQNEEEQQNRANEEFDDIFGDGHGMDNFGDSHGGNNNLFNDLDHNNHLLDDDGLKDLNMGGIFEDMPDTTTYTTGHAIEKEGRKRNLASEENRLLKKQKLEKLVKKLEKRRIKRNIAYHFPTYSRHKAFNFHVFFLPQPRYYRYQRPPIALKESVKPLVPTKLNLEVEVDQKKLFKSRKAPVEPKANKGIVNITQADFDFIKDLNHKSTQRESFLKQISFLSNDWTNNDKFTDFSKDLILSTTDWNDDAIINAGDDEFATKKVNIDNDIINVQSDDEEDENIFNGVLKTDLLKLDMNDPNLLFVPAKKTNKAKSLIPTTEKLLQLKFNISNDKQYEILKKNYNTKVRSQLSNLNIEHAIPALRLQTPYYKVKLTKKEARSFHRPTFNIRPGSLISFSKLKLRKKKKDRGKSLQEIFSKTTDLSTTDTAPLIAMEYSEEYPNILSNFGMGSKLINYYRKEREDDSSRPKTQIGETHVLGVEDRSPFWNFGEVAPGDFVPTLYNNMIRAPIFKHDSRNTDFLLIKSQGAGSHQKYYLRSINFIFAVGNIFPAVEIPAPHSRKVTNTSKNRLKMVVFRVMNSMGVARVSVKDVSKHFPDQNDMQNRQRLKEFMEYKRQGDDQGYWKIRNSDTVPTETEIRSMITPEDSCLLDSMQYGQQTIDDTNMKEKEKEKKEKEKEKEKEKKDEADKEKEKENENETEEGNPKKEKEKEKERTRRPRDPDAEVDMDEELAPWNLSRNFVNSNQTKAMLQLNGEGDPTGIGLGYSFLRSTQKNGFKPLFAPVKENVPKNNTAAYQQRLYEAEVKRIWYSQRSSLVDHGPDFNLQTIYDEYRPVNQDKVVKHLVKQEDKDLYENKVLKITRRVRDENGIVQRRVETLTDPRLITAYIKRKKQIEDELLKNAEVGDILPTNDKELNKLRRKALEEKLASLEKKNKQNRAKKPPKYSIHAAAAAGGTIIDANTVMLPDGSYAIGGKGIGKGKSTTRRCASCGAFGHIRTNKTCPLYSLTKGGTIPVKKDENGNPIMPPTIILPGSAPTASSSTTTTKSGNTPASAPTAPGTDNKSS